MELVWWAKLQLLAEAVGSAGTHSVEDVVVTLLVVLHADTGLLQQVVGNIASSDKILQIIIINYVSYTCVCVSI